MELKDIVLKKGDVIYFKNGDRRTNLGDIDHKVSQESPEFFSINDIVKIERPKYEIIYEAKEILDKEEKEYLEAVLRPFKNRVKYIRKVGLDYCSNKEAQIFIRFKVVKDSLWLPPFKTNTIYKGMELDKEYTLKELELFKGE